jgi:hypothetical protein
VTKAFNEHTGQSLTPAEYCALTLTVLKKGMSKVEQAIKAMGLSVSSGDDEGK